MPSTSVTVRFWAGARRAAGRAEETLTCTSLAEVRAVLSARPPLTDLMVVASVLVDGQAAHDDTRLAPGAVIDILPPFAGG